MNEDDLLSPEEVAKILKVTPGTLANWRCSGNGPRYVKSRAGRSPVQYRRSAVSKYVEDSERSSTSEVAA